jgi:hypothetical protein
MMGKKNFKVEMVGKYLMGASQFALVMVPVMTGFSFLYLTLALKTYGFLF